jgi:hypothetical protein
VPAALEAGEQSGADWPAEPAELKGYLDDVELDLGWTRRTGGHLTLELRLGLFPLEPLDRGHGLDSYLFPLVQRLGPVRFDAAFAVKAHAERSWLRVAPSAPGTVAELAEPAGTPQVRARMTASATSIDWKEQLYRACREATPEPAPAGPVAVQLRLGVSRRRNWSALWQPALDALGPILGVPDPTRPYRAADDRITELALHRRLDDYVGNQVDVEIWWRPAVS